MTVFTTYNATGLGHNQRDVSDYITNVSPDDTPIFHLLPSTSATARYKENVTDTLPAANADNAMVEGADFSDDDINTRNVEANYLQIFKRTINISGTQEAVMKYGGVKSEMGYQEKIQYKAIGNDVEKALVVGTGASGATGTARKLTGMLAKVSTNAVTASLTSATWTGSADADFVAYENLLVSLFQKGWDNGVKFDHLAVGSTHKIRISKLTQKVTRQIQASAKSQILTIDTYESDFGVVNVLLERYVPNTSILAFALDMFEVAYLRRFVQTPLAKTGDATRMAIVGELTLDCKTEKGAGSIVAS